MLEAKDLGNLLLMQNMIVGLPDTVSIYEFVCRGLSFLPGVVSVTHSESAGPIAATDRNILEYRVVMGLSDYGTLRIQTDAPERLLAYDPYLKNFAFMISVILEERRQRKENEESRRSLESRVVERTAQLESAVRTKEILLRELYHRTRNSLQLICALLDIESSYLEDSAARTVLRDMKNRVFAMSAAHSMLFRKQDLSRIRAEEYLRSLLDQVRMDYSDASSRVEYRLDVQGDLILLIDTAVPLGIVLIEIVSNALKFAFPEDRRGTLSVSLRETEPDRLSMAIRDDGIGFPEGFDYRKHGKMGLENIINIVEKQLGGTLSVDGAAGVGWNLEFRGDLNEARV